MKDAGLAGEMKAMQCPISPPAEVVTVRRELLHEVLAAFSEGSSKPVIDSEESSGRLYEAMFQNTVNTRLPAPDASFFWKCLGQRQEALEAARNNRLDEASCKFSALRRQIFDAALADESRLFLQVFLEAAEAYLCYRSADYGHARELLLHASSLDHLLVEKYRYDLMSAHRLQLAHNLLRLYNRQGNSGESVEIGAALLDYLELRTDSLPVELGSPRARLDSVPVSVVSYYFDKICSECALVLAGTNDKRVTALFGPLAHHAGLQHAGSGDMGYMAHEWLRLKWLALSQESAAALTIAQGALRRGRHTEPLLWFATILDVAALCRSFEADGHVVAATMIGEAAQFSDAPFALRRLA